MANSQLDAIHASLAESKREAMGEPEMTPVEKINLGFQQAEDKAIAELTDEVDGLSKIAAKAMTYRTGNNAAVWYEFGRGERNHKTIQDLKAKYKPVRDGLDLKYHGRMVSHSARLFWDRVLKHLSTLDKAFED